MSPSDEYKRRLSEREARATHLQTISHRIGNVRLFLVAIAIAVACGSLYYRAFSVLWTGVPVAMFVCAVLYHSTVRGRLARNLRAASFYRHGLARIEDRWHGTGQSGDRFNDPHHIYAADLDLFGKGSLFELLSTARMRMGEETLARWLLSPSSVAAIRERHRCVHELRARLDFREDVAVEGAEGTVAVQPERLLQWAEAANEITRPGLRAASVLLPAAAVASATVWGFTGIAAPLLVVLLSELGIMMWLGKRIDRALNEAEVAFDDLKVLATLLERLERERFETPRLQALMRKLTSHTLAASVVIERLSTIASLAQSRRNSIVAVLNIPLMYSVHVILAAERWRAAHGAVIRSWLDALGEIEAILSIATYSYEHPGDPFPEFLQGPASLHGEDLGHPLLPRSQCVPNTIKIGGKPKVLLVSGSNMSGKSTLLRTVGINTVLAMTGAPVRAHSMQLTHLHVGASIRINDSLHEGSSRFYAEITRLRQLFDVQSDEGALLFLLDELLQGTNSVDRRIGAEGILRALVNRGAIGMISTHDLALTDISGLSDGTLRNVHFQDEYVDGRLKFDFRLREGVVTKSNGVELMRSIGLDV